MFTYSRPYCTLRLDVTINDKLRMTSKNEIKEFQFTNLTKQLSTNRKKLLKASGLKLSKEEKRQLKVEPNQVACVYDFIGDVDAKAAAELGQVVNLVISEPLKFNHFIIKVTSGGGTVNGYGLAAAELARLKSANIKVTALVDRVAASGGYMLACVSDLLVAAPSAYVGSIGVVAQLPNFNQFLEDKGVKVFELTAGDKKRSLTMLGKPDQDKENHMLDKLETMHDLFISHVTNSRPKMLELDSDMSATVFSGDYWTAKETVDNGYNLVDELKTSEEFLFSLFSSHNLIEIKLKEKKKGLVSRLIGVNVDSMVNNAMKSLALSFTEQLRSKETNYL